MKRFVKQAGAAALFVLLPAIAAGALAAPNISVEVKGDKLSIAVSEAASLDAVLKRVGEAVGATVEGGSCERTVGPIKLDLVSFDDALRGLAPEHSLIVERDAKTARVKRLLLVEGVGTGQPAGTAMPGEPPGAPQDANQSDEAQQQAMLQQQATGIMTGNAAMRNRRAAAMRDVVKLGYGKDRASAQQLEDTVRTGETTEVRAAALASLAKSSGQGPVAYLKARLMSDADPQVRLSAALAIAQLVPEQAKSVIAKAAAMEADPDIRQQLEIMTGE